ncbi:MAG: hypothetical protein SWY16_16150 [Cyanobacteriota bacterium]|nr:hypothetical protein [Cyanobacteriota bacterium]
MTTFSSIEVKRPTWQTLVTFALALWLGGSLVLDLVVVPSLWEAGMMNQPGFASAGFMTFESFNHLELLFAGTAMTGVFWLSGTNYFAGGWRRTAIILSSMLLVIPLIYTYFLTPQMSGMGLQLDAFDPIAQMPSEMIPMHVGYWTLEVLKFVAISGLLIGCDRR